MWLMCYHCFACAFNKFTQEEGKEALSNQINDIGGKWWDVNFSAFFVVTKEKKFLNKKKCKKPWHISLAYTCLLYADSPFVLKCSLSMLTLNRKEKRASYITKNIPVQSINVFVINKFNKSHHSLRKAYVHKRKIVSQNERSEKTFHTFSGRGVNNKGKSYHTVRHTTFIHSKLPVHRPYSILPLVCSK